MITNPTRTIRSRVNPRSEACIIMFGLIRVTDFNINNRIMAFIPRIKRKKPRKNRIPRRIKGEVLVSTDLGLISKENANWLFTQRVLGRKGQILAIMVPGISQKLSLLKSDGLMGRSELRMILSFVRR